MKRRKLILVVLMVFVMTFGASCQTIKVFKTTDSIHSFIDGSGAKLKNVQDFELVDFSVCFRFFFFSDRNMEVSLLHSRLDEDALEGVRGNVIFGVVDTMLKDESKILLGLMNDWSYNSFVWPVMSWHHVCLSYEKKTSIMTVVSDGERVLTKVTFEHLKNNPKSIPTQFPVSYTHLTLPTNREV